MTGSSSKGGGLSEPSLIYEETVDFIVESLDGGEIEFP